jgi:hypothetical protein
VLSRVRHCGTRTPGSCCRPSRDGRQSTSRLPSNLARPGRGGGGPAYVSPARPRRKPGQLATQAPPARPLHSLCAGGTGRCPACGHPPRRGARGRLAICPRQQPAGSGQAATLPLATVASHPGSRQPGLSPGCKARLTGLARVTAGALTTACYLACTCGGPLMDLAAEQQASGGFDPARAGRSPLVAGTGTLPAGPGHCQVHGRSMPGRRKVCRRAARGRPEVHARSVVAGCMGFRTRPLPVTRSPSCVMTPGPAARPPGRRPPASPAGRAGRRASWRCHAQPAGFR